MNITFLGGARTVTGSKYLVETPKSKILIDCGLFQGLKELRVKNWDPFPVDLNLIDAIFLTHAHIDHSGFIPRIYKLGYSNSIFATKATIDLCEILLPDSGYLQEEDARFANKKGYSKHVPALPLYTEEEARNCLGQFKEMDFHKPIQLKDLKITYFGAGHILGAASILVESEGKSVVFSGDIGRTNDLINPKPEPPFPAQAILMESTYGSRNHEKRSPLPILKDIIEKIKSQSGVLLIPAFAVGRTQLLLYCIYQIFQKNPEMKIPVFVNSPMATKASKLYYLFHEEHRLTKEQTREMFEMATFVQSVEESKALNLKKGPIIIISSSGMLTGGRILHHIKAFAPDPRNAIILAGYQAPGTRGEALINGKKELKIHGEEVSINAKIYDLNLLSAHADQEGLLQWIKGIPKKPNKICLVHGTLESAQALKEVIHDQMNVDPHIPELGQELII